MKLFCFITLFLILPFYTIAQTLKYDTLERETVGSLYNAHFLIGTRSEDPEEIKRMTTAILNQFTSDGKKLNQVFFWKNKDAYVELKYRKGQFRSDNFEYSHEKMKIALDKWDRVHRALICDNLMAIYSGAKFGIDLFPYRDTDYKKYGGTKNRPDESFVLLVLTPSSVQNPESDSEVSIGSIAQISLIALVVAGVFLYAVYSGLITKRSSQ